jgi:hypothetical protein
MAAGLPSSSLPRARAVADLPLADLRTREQELTRRWAIALIAAQPVGDLGSVPLSALASSGPELCGGVLRALGSEAELERLRESAASLRELSGESAATLAAAVEALRGASWELLLEALGVQSVSTRQLGEVADRLAYVCSSLLTAALARAEVGDEPAVPVTAPGGEGEPLEGLAPPRIGATIAIFDERGEGVSPPRGDWDEHRVGRGGALEARLRARGPVPASDAERDIEIRDERREEGPGAWISSIGRQLAQHSVDGKPFAVLLVEVLELERASRGQDPEGLLSRLERLLEDELTAAAGGSWLTRERPGRCWLIVPETDRFAAQRLAEQLVSSVARARQRLGVPLAIVVGTAVCPEDGERAPSLAAHADVGLYAARAATVRSAQGGDGASG